MHIGFDAKRAFSNITGLGNYSRYTINALCKFYPENRYSLYTPSVYVNKLYHPPENSETCLPDSIWSKNLKAYWRSIGIVNSLKKDHIDLFHGLSNEIPLNIEKAGIRSVVTIHDLIFLRFPTLYKAIDRRIYLTKSKYAVSSANRIIAISRQTKQDLIELLNVDERKIRIVYQGCNPWFYTKVNKEVTSELKVKYNLPDEYLLYVGTIEERKNLLDIIKAVHLEGIDIPIVAVGRKTQYFNQIEKYISLNNIKNIYFLHQIRNQELPSIYQMAKAFVYPSIYEGFGIPILEALNSGTPVVTSRGGCLEETAGKGAILVNPGNIDELAEAIKQVLDNSEKRRELIQSGLRHALEFREDKTIPQLINIYQECIQ